MRFRSLAFSAGLTLFLSGSTAFGAQGGWIKVQEAELLEGPGSNYRVLGKIPLGTGLAVSNYATEGHYRVRTRTGKVGWVPSASILLKRDRPDRSFPDAPDSDQSLD